MFYYLVQVRHLKVHEMSQYYALAQQLFFYSSRK